MVARIVHTGDSHIDSDVHGSINPQTGVNRAWEAHADALASVVEHAVDQSADLFVHAGDAFKNGRPSQEAVQLFADTLQPLVEAGIPILLLDGNHERIVVPTNQRTATSTVARMLTGSGGEVHVVEREPRLVRTASGIQIAALPWLSKTSILARLGEERLTPAEGDRRVVDYALAALDTMHAEADDRTPFILASHVTVEDVQIDSVSPGHTRGSEMDIASLFAEPILPRRAIEESGVSYAALSHIHARQRIGEICYYAGSPDRLTMTDADDPKSANLIDVSDDNSTAVVHHLETRARLLHSIDMTADNAAARVQALRPGALVRLVLEPGESVPDPEVRKAITDAGASIVTIKVVPKERVRASTTVVAERTDPLSALRTYLTDRQPDCDHDHAIALAATLVDGDAA